MNLARFRVLIIALAIAAAFNLPAIGNAADIIIHGAGYIGDARAVGLAPNGEIWIGSSGSVAVYSQTGDFLRYETKFYHGGQINSIQFQADGTPIFGNNEGDIVIASADGDKAKDVVLTGFGSYAPWEVACDRAGNLLATDTNKARILCFNVGGTRLLTFQTTANGDTPDIKRPYSLALDSQDRVFVSDQDQPGLWIYAHDGTFLKRILPTTKFWRIKRTGSLLYAASDSGVEVIDPATETITKHIDIQSGYINAMGFAVDSSGDLFAGNFTGGLVREYGPDGKLIRTLGPAYQLTVTLPDSLPLDHASVLPVRLDNPTNSATPPAMPSFSMDLLPADTTGEPDLNFADLGGTTPDPAWQERRKDYLKSQGYTVDLKPVTGGLQATLPADTPTGVYALAVRADSADPTTTSQSSSVTVIRPGAKSSLTLYIPRERSVFQQGEQVEVNLILRTAATTTGGLIDFSLRSREGAALGYDPSAPAWLETSAPPMASGTLTYYVTAADIQPGRYVLQARYRGDGMDMHDVWPIEIVSPIQTTRFRILSPEWSAGYTAIWGPYDGAGMQADAVKLSDEGINLYDTCVIQRGMGVMDYPLGRNVPDTSALIKLAQSDPALPAPERFIAPEPFEIEFQEALRNHMSVQRDFWGSHMLDDWGFANSLSIPRDNRIAQLWTQWQREWPSWIGHRYLTLSLADENNPEADAIKVRLKTASITPPTEDDLKWARNAGERKFITDAPYPVGSSLMGIGSDSAGNIYVGCASGDLLKLSPDGKLLRTTKFPGALIEIAVAPDGTVWGAHMGGVISTTRPDGAMTFAHVADFGAYSPRGICIAPDGSLLLTDQQNGKIRRFTQGGKLLAVIGSKENLNGPAGIATAKDGTIFVVDGDKGGTMTFKADGTPLKFLPGMGGQVPGGKAEIHATADDNFWVSDGFGSISLFDRNGNRLKRVGRTTFAPGGMSLPTAIALTPGGNLLVTDVALPYAQELTPDGDPIRLLASGTFFDDVRLDRQRYTFSDRTIASVWSPIPGLEGNPGDTLQAFARLSTDSSWSPLSVTAFAGRNFQIAVPHDEGEVTLRLIYAPQGAATDDPRHADYTVQVSAQTSQIDDARLADIVQRRRAFDNAWVGSRMSALVRWTGLSDLIRPGTQDTAPTNYGLPDTTTGAVWVPWRRDALVAEAENEGHDYGTYTLMGSWYVARALEGPDPKPAWSSLLDWYWETTAPDGTHIDVTRRPRPERDYTMLLGAGASGIGTGEIAYKLPPKALATHRKMVDRLQRIGEAAMALGLPGQGGVAVLHSYTQETMDAANDEQFYAAQAAWYDLLRAHIPVAVTSEESVAAGELVGRFKAVLIPYVLYALPADTMAGLAKFQQLGGAVWIDLGSRIAIPGAHVLKTRYRPFWIEDAYYNINNGYGVGAYDGNSEYVHMKIQSDLRLPAIREAFGNLAITTVSLADPNFFEMERRGGEAVYNFIGNDHYPETPLYKSAIGAQTPVPASATIHFSGAAVYDAYAGRRVESPNQTLDFTDDEPARLYVSLPKAIESVSLTASFADNRISAAAAVHDSAGNAIPGVIPIAITIADSSGKVAFHLFRATDPTGTLDFGVPVGWMAPLGHWTVTVKELLSNMSSAAVLVSVSAHVPARIQQATGSCLIFDSFTIRQWLAAMRGQEVWIALDKNQTAVSDVASALAKSLTDRGINAKVINIGDIPEEDITLNYALAPADQDVLDRIKAGNSVGLRVDNASKTFRTPGPRRIIMRNLILLGEPDQNRWLADIDGGRLTRRQITPFYPGPNRGLIQFCWAPFYDGFNAVTIGATDAHGLSSGINALTALLPPAVDQ